jgi:hypothetical protein
MKASTIAIRSFQFHMPYYEIQISVKKKTKNIHMHKSMHTTTITIPGTPTFNNFSFNVKLYVNMMHIFNNLSFT